MERTKSNTYTYKGPAYIRPIGRGIMLKDVEEYLSDALYFAFGTGDFNMEITVKILPQNEEKRNEKNQNRKE